MISFIFSFLFLLSAEDRASREPVNEFDIKVSGISIGNIKGYHEVNSDSTKSYVLKTQVDIWFFINIRFEQEVTTRYQNDILVLSEVETISNKGIFTSRAIRKKDRYYIDANAYQHSLKREFRQLLRYSVARLFFEKPTENSFVLTDTYGEIVKMEKINGHKFVIRANGSTQYYTYKGNELQFVQVTTDLIDYRIEKIGS